MLEFVSLRQWERKLQVCVCPVALSQGRTVGIATGVKTVYKIWIPLV